MNVLIINIGLIMINTIVNYHHNLVDDYTTQSQAFEPRCSGMIIIHENSHSATRDSSLALGLARFQPERWLLRVSQPDVAELMHWWIVPGDDGMGNHWDVLKGHHGYPWMFQYSLGSDLGPWMTLDSVAGARTAQRFGGSAGLNGSMEMEKLLRELMTD